MTRPQESEGTEPGSAWDSGALKTVSAFADGCGGSMIVGHGPDGPYHLKDKGLREGGVFIRRGTSSVAAPEDLVLRMVRDRHFESYESLPSQRQDLTFDYTSDVFERKGKEFGARQMESLGMTRNGTYTNLAFMLSDQFDQGIKMAVFEDEFKGEFQDREEASGSVLSQFDAAYRFVDMHNSRRSRIVGPDRVDSRDYPEEAVREALMNAIAHRDYALRGDISVSMFKDRMTVVSLGGLNTGIGMEDIMAGVSSRRNERLASVLYLLGIMETYGTGIPRMAGLYRDQPMRPSISVTRNSFKITLPKLLPYRLSEEAVRIADLASDGRPIRRSDVESLLGVSKTKAASVLSELETAGVLTRTGSGRNTAYELSRRENGHSLSFAGEYERMRTKGSGTPMALPCGTRDCIDWAGLGIGGGTAYRAHALRNRNCYFGPHSKK